MADTRYFIVGGGASSAKAAVAIRERDKTGRVILASRENRFPYDRPPLSKDLLQKDGMTAEDPESKDPSWYEANHVEIRRGVEVRRVDRAAHSVELADGSTISYEKLLLATGASAVKPDLPGLELENVFFLRTVDDALNIRAAIKRGGKAVMIGGGYIGLEVSASATQRGIHCTIIEPGARPWARFASGEAGEYVQKRYAEEGVVFRFGDHAARLLGNGSVSGVRTLSGDEIPADFVVVGVGARLNDELAKTAGLTMAVEGGVQVSEMLQTDDPDIYAAGDLAAYVDKFTGKRMHVEHYMNATWTGTTAGANMAGANEPFDRVPYFYSDAFDIHMALRGTPGGRLVKTAGDVASGNFVEFWADDTGKLQSGLAVSRTESNLEPISDELEELIRQRAGVDSIGATDFDGIA